MLEPGKSVRRMEQQRQCVMNRHQLPLTIPLHHSGQEVEKIGTEVEPGRKGDVRGRCF